MNKKEYRIFIDDRSYTSWSFQNPYTNDEYKENLNIDPSKLKLFSKDIFSMDTESKDDVQITITYSPIRTAKTLAGVLQLSTNKTYGRTSNKKRLLYKCIPDDKHLPVFLVPYEVAIGFNKTQSNKYVVFRFDHWTQKHPYGLLVETIGDVSRLEAFYEYQLFCKSLHTSLSEITQTTKKALLNRDYIKEMMEDPRFCVQNRIDVDIFTIDPPNSLDFDDGFSIRLCDKEASNTILSVYISNVYMWLETLDLWNSLSNRVSTIYLPDRRRPMLPTVLSDALCSLQEGQIRFAFVMELTIDISGRIISDPLFYNAAIQVKKNYRYEEPQLLQNLAYNQLLTLTKKMERYIDNSHDVVSYWMIQMNTICAMQLLEAKTGIFRSACFTNPQLRDQVDVSTEDKGLSDETRRVIQMWNNTSGQYTRYSSDVPMVGHALMKLKSYIHMTSPIRRLVDLLNQMMFSVSIMRIKISEEARTFLERWLTQLDYINTAMRSIRKVQTDCEILYRCSTCPELMDLTHEGTLFDKIVKHDGTITYMVFIEKWKMMSRISTNQDMPNYSVANFRIFFFEEEDQTKKKIRLQIV
jgi:exoribonuclease R